jgi:D-alanyl-D-alanine-carboxypeptidase/D-alanyl-D-alanine-endopeptidase
MKTLVKRISTVLLALLLSTTSHANKDTIEFDSVEATLHNRLSNGYGVGMAVGIIDNNHTRIITLGKPQANTDQPIDEQSIFEIGSITKAFTGIILADMVLKGEVSLDDPVQQFLPKTVTMPSKKGRQITLLDLVTHRSGLPRIPSNLKPENIKNPYAGYSVQDMYDFLSKHSLSRKVGEKAEYSNLGMGLLGHVLALRANSSYEQLVHERITVPLGMADTVISISPSQEKQLTYGHDAVGEKTEHWDLPTFAGAGALRSTAKDMIIFLKTNMGALSSPLDSAIQLSHQVQFEFETKETDIGLAWITTKTPTSTVTWHNGGTGGYRSFIGMDKEQQRGVVVLANSQDDADQIGKAILSNQLALLEPEKSEDIRLSTEEIAQRIGEYQIAPDFTLTISEQAGALYAQATGQEKLLIFPKSKNDYFIKTTKASLTFNADKKGNVDSLVLHQNGNHKAIKLTNRPEPESENSKNIILSSKEIAQRIGEYQLAPNITLTITEKSGKLYAQATGKPKRPIYSKSKNDYFFKVAKASLTFNAGSSGDVNSLILHQNGNHKAIKMN